MLAEHRAAINDDDDDDFSAPVVKWTERLDGIPFPLPGYAI